MTNSSINEESVSDITITQNNNVYLFKNHEFVTRACELWEWGSA